VRGQHQAALGLVGGLGGLMLAPHKQWAPGVAAGLNGVVLLVVVALPGWLGMRGWLPDKGDAEARAVKAVNYDGRSAAPAEWVDSSKGSWQQNDVRVAVTSTSVGPVELTGPDQKKKWTAEKYLQVWLHVENAGVARKLECQGWEPAPGAAPRLNDTDDKELALKTFEGDFQPAGRPHAAALFPGRGVDYLLVFEKPAATGGPLRLELPGKAWGGSEPARFEIPRSSLLSWPSPR
jgi:hypothetical protein